MFKIKQKLYDYIIDILAEFSSFFFLRLSELNIVLRSKLIALYAFQSFGKHSEFRSKIRFLTSKWLQFRLMHISLYSLQYLD